MDLSPTVPMQVQVYVTSVFPFQAAKKSENE